MPSTQVKGDTQSAHVQTLCRIHWEEPVLYAARNVVMVVVIMILASSLQSAFAQTSRTVVRDRFSDVILGTGPDLIFVPGLGSSRDTWKSAVTHLSSHYRLHLIQVAGFAGEPVRSNAGDKVLVVTAEAIDAYLKSQHLTPATIIGHSLGGTMILYLVERHPNDIRKALLVDTVPYFATTMGNPNATVESMAPIAARIRADSTPDTPEQLGQRMASMATAESDKELIANWSQSSDQSVIRKALADDLTLDLRPGLASISTPLTLMYADYVPVGAPKGAADAQNRAAFSAVPHMTFVPISNALHFLMLDQPKQFESGLDAFLAN